MDHGVEVAAVSQVPDASIARPEERPQGPTGLLDQLPLANPLVHIDLQFGHRLVCLYRKDSVRQTLYFSAPHFFFWGEGCILYGTSRATPTSVLRSSAEGPYVVQGIEPG